jgi:transcriptional regulator with XRE-family HTH domain
LFDVWSARTVASYITSCGHSRPITSAASAESVRKLIAREGISDAAALGRAIGVSRITAWYWLTGAATPDIDNVLRMCFRFNLSLVDFVSGHIPRHATGENRNVIELDPHPRRRSPKRFDVGEVSGAIHALMKSRGDDPPSLEDVGRVTGFAVRTIRRWLPALCRDISAGHRKSCAGKIAARRRAVRLAIRDAIAATRGENLRPTRRNIGQHLQKPGILRSPENRKVVEQLLLDFGYQ